MISYRIPITCDPQRPKQKKKKKRDILHTHNDLPGGWGETQYPELGERKKKELGDSSSLQLSAFEDDKCS